MPDCSALHGIAKRTQSFSKQGSHTLPHFHSASTPQIHIRPALSVQSFITTVCALFVLFTLNPELLGYSNP
jgi:hypothetical protein